MSGSVGLMARELDRVLLDSLLSTISLVGSAVAVTMTSLRSSTSGAVKVKVILVEPPEAIAPVCFTSEWKSPITSFSLEPDTALPP